MLPSLQKTTAWSADKHTDVTTKTRGVIVPATAGQPEPQADQPGGPTRTEDAGAQDTNGLFDNGDELMEISNNATKANTVRRAPAPQPRARPPNLETRMASARPRRPS